MNATRRRAACRQLPDLGSEISVPKLDHQPIDAAEFQISPENRPDLFGLLLTITSFPSFSSWPSGTMPPTQSPLRLDAAILSRMRSAVTSRSNCANEAAR